MKSGGFLSRVTAVLVSVAMVFSLLATGPNEAQAGLIVNAIGCKWSAIALNTVERTVLWGIGKAESATDNDVLASVLSATKRIISGKSGIVAAQTLAEVKHVSAQLSALYSYTDSSTRTIEDMISRLESNEKKTAFDTNAALPVDNFTSKYDGMVATFNNLLAAYTNYCDAPTDDNRLRLENCYNTIYDSYYKNTDVYSEFTAPLMGEANATGFLSLISPYNPNYKPNAEAAETVAEPDDMCDPDRWGSFRPSASVDTTYLGYYYAYITTVTDFQNNVYDSMRSAASVISNAAYTYLQAYRYYAEFKAMMIAGDASLSERDQREQTTSLWNGFYDAAHKLVRGLNQMCDTQQDVFTTYMRTWDVHVGKKISNYESPIKFGEMLHEYKDANPYKDEDGEDTLELVGENTNHCYKVDMYCDVMQPTQYIYQFRLVSNPSKAYAIRSSTRSSDEGDGVSRAFYAIDTRMYTPSTDSDDTSPSTDLLTVLKGLEGGFAVPKNMSELSAIAQGPAYQQSRLLTENIGSELTFALGSDNVHLPEVTAVASSMESDDIKDGPNFMALRSAIWWTCCNTALFGNPDAVMTFGNASMPYAPANQAMLDLEDDIWDKRDGSLKNKEVVVMWTGNPSQRLSLDVTGAGEAYVTVGDKRLSDGENATFASGTSATITVNPAQDATLSAVRLLGADGKVLEELFSSETISDPAGQVLATITSQEMLDLMASEDGSYSFTVPVPYQDATVEVVFESDLERTFEVTLTDVPADTPNTYDAVLQFGDYDFLGRKSFGEGARVIVSACGYHGHVPSGLIITDGDGRPLDIAYEEVPPEEMAPVRPTERLYALTMPARDVNVTAELADAHTVTVNDSAHVTHAFENLEVMETGTDASTDWAHATTLDFVAGEAVTISFEVSPGYLVYQVEVFDDSNNLVPARAGADSISFTMPPDDVTVRFTERRVDTSKRTLTLVSDPGRASLWFSDRNGRPLNVVSRQFDVDENVEVTLTLADTLLVEDMVLVRDGSDANVFADQEGSVEGTSGTVRVSFTMPDANATLSANVREATPEEIDGMDIDDQGRILIRTYEELVKFAQVVRANPEHYTKADAMLANNINCTGKPAWTEGIGQDVDGHRYDAVFEGNGHFIFGLRIAADRAGGLFESVGESGTVRNLFLFDCDFESRPSVGGGIAAVNHGRIEYCVNGLNLTNGVFVRPETGDLVSLREYNSFVDATTAGGIVGRNEGTVHACRSSAEVNATWYAGGITGVNAQGTVSNCASNAKVSSTSRESMMNHDMGYYYGSGGLCGGNYGTVRGGYSSALVSANDAKGSIAFDQDGTLYDTYYTTSEGQQPFQVVGSRHSETNVGGLTRGEMMTDSFVDMLMGTGSNQVVWIRSNPLNAGLPRIRNTMAFDDTTLTGDDVSVQGNLHKDARLRTLTVSSRSEAWERLSRDADGHTPIALYSCTLTDDQGNFAPAELWSQSELTYVVPVRSTGAVANVLYVDGTTSRLTPKGVEKGASGMKATFVVDGAAAFMVLEPQSDGSSHGPGSSGNPGRPSPTPGRPVFGPGTSNPDSSQLPDLLRLTSTLAGHPSDRVYASIPVPFRASGYVGGPFWHDRVSSKDDTNDAASAAGSTVTTQVTPVVTPVSPSPYGSAGSTPVTTPGAPAASATPAAAAATPTTGVTSAGAPATGTAAADAATDKAASAKTPATGDAVWASQTFASALAVVGIPTSAFGAILRRLRRR